MMLCVAKDQYRFDSRNLEIISPALSYLKLIFGMPVD